ncbi:MAG: hypothetical protein ACW99H_12005 [Candidatus Thorarchaeota archaeon]
MTVPSPLGTGLESSGFRVVADSLHIVRCCLTEVMIDNRGRSEDLIDVCSHRINITSHSKLNPYTL